SYSLMHTERLGVRPGITGLWQVSARGNTDFDNWVEWDMAYIDRASLSLDLRILVETVMQVIKRKGAR
ncbi:MAG: sugar transferase, partial [Chloroflexota bacterium]